MNSILDNIRTLCEEIEGYTFVFEESKLMNVKADNLRFPCIYFEEYRSGHYKMKYALEKTTRVQLYFMDLVPMHADGSTREVLREKLEQAIEAFIGKFNASGLFREIQDWQFFAAPPRFDANEVSIMLQFDCTQTGC